MSLLRHGLICMLLCLLAPWASGQALADARPCHAHAETMVVAQFDAAAAAQPTAQHRPPALRAAAPPAPETGHCPLPCKDCSACHVVAIPPSMAWVRSPEAACAAPLWSPSLSQGRARVCELLRPPQA